MCGARNAPRRRRRRRRRRRSETFFFRKGFDDDGKEEEKRDLDRRDNGRRLKWSVHFSSSRNNELGSLPTYRLSLVTGGIFFRFSHRVGGGDTRLF